MKLIRTEYENLPKKSFELSTILDSWDGWDQMDIMACTYYDAVLSLDLDPYKKGVTLPWVSVDLQRCFVEIPDPENEDASILYQIQFDSVVVL